MSRFAIRTPYLIIVLCLVILVLGVVSVVQMPVDLFPAMDIPVVAVATFYSGMPPEQVEGNITYHLERFFTLASGIDHMESRSLAGVSVIKVYFQPGTNPDSAVTTIASLAMAEISHLPPGTLPPFVLKMDASSLPVCLVTLKGEGLSETQLKDLAQNVLRNQLAGVQGCGGTSTVWRALAADDALRRPLQAGIAPDEPDGCGALHQRIELDSAGGRCANWPI